MIIQIRGTSGSGKSTVMRAVKDSLGYWNSVHENGRRQPIYYCLNQPKKIIIMGHYETPCGGCDTIGSARQVYHRVKSLLDVDDNRIILCEGLLLSEDTKWSSRINNLRVLYLTTSLAKCLFYIKKRRREAGNEKKLNPKNTANRVSVIERSRIKLIKQGIICRRGSAKQAPGILLRWIKDAQN